MCVYVGVTGCVRVRGCRYYANLKGIVHLCILRGLGPPGEIVGVSVDAVYLIVRSSPPSISDPNSGAESTYGDPDRGPMSARLRATQPITSIPFYSTTSLSTLLSIDLQLQSVWMQLSSKRAAL